MSNTTLLLWSGPFIIFLVGLVFLIRFVRSRGKDDPANELTEEQKRQAAELLKGK